MVIKDGWHKLADGNHSFTLTHEHGKIIYLVKTNEIEDLLGDLIFQFLAKLDNLPTNWSEIEKITGIPAEKYLDVEITLESGEIIEETEAVLDEAVKYFTSHIGEMFTAALERFISETLVNALMTRADKGHYVFHATGYKILESLEKIHLDTLKERIGVKKASGKPRYWKPEREKEFLSLYEPLAQLLKEVKKACTKYKREDKSKEGTSWKKKVLADFPLILPEMIDDLSKGGKDAEPAAVALKYVAKTFDDASITTLQKVITRARKSTENE